ncbi:unnamed protein product, partial [Pylaiella littoralis]
VKVQVDALDAPCLVLPAGTDMTSQELNEQVPTFLGEGFVTFLTNPRRVKEQRPWRKEGVDGLYFDRDADSYDNVDGDPVFSTGIAVSSDGFNYWSFGGKVYNVNATYVALSCLSPALLRRLRSWSLVCAGSKGRWEEEVGGLMETIQHLEKGCRARMKTQDGHSVTVFVRMGLLTAMLDTPYHSAWSNTKGSNSKTKKPCSTCEVTQEELSDHQYNIGANLRTQDGIDDSLLYVKAGDTAADQARRSRERGVVVPDVDNPLKKLVFDRVRGIGVDILHQDSLNKAKRMIRFLLNALNTDGSALVSGRLKLRSIIPPNAEPLGDVTTDGGFSALTGNQIWVLSSILPLLFRPIFANHMSMVSK